MRLRGTNFCTSSAHFAPSFVRQPNGPEWTQIVQNAQKIQFRVQWGGSGVFVSKNSDATSLHELLHQFGLFCTKFRKATKLFQMHPNSKKHTKIFSLGSNGCIRCVRYEKFLCDFVARTFTNSARFAPSFVRQPNGPECTQIVRIAPEHQFRVQWGRSSAFVMKNSVVTSWH